MSQKIHVTKISSLRVTTRVLDKKHYFLTGNSIFTKSEILRSKTQLLDSKQDFYTGYTISKLETRFLLGKRDFDKETFLI